MAPPRRSHGRRHGGHTPVPEGDREPQAAEIDCIGSTPGDRIRLVHPWEREQEQHLLSMIQPLADDCGLVIAGQPMGEPRPVGELAPTR